MPAEFKRAITKLQLALDKATKLLPGLAFKTAEAKVEALVSDLRALESAIPSPPQSLADVALRAQLVLHWSAESIVEMKS